MASLQEHTHRHTAGARIALCLSILQGGRPHDENTAQLAAAALGGADLAELVLLDVIGFGAAA